jgi:dynein heavy chain, axonemal
VGKGQLIDDEADLGIEGKIPKLVEMFKNIHKSVEHNSSSFLMAQLRDTYLVSIAIDYV